MMAEKKVDTPIKKLPNPNIFLSKADFIAMREKEKKVKAKLEAYKRKAEEEIESEGVEDTGSVETVATVKKSPGRPKLVKD